ncbi:MAG: hypothetical protein IIZ44_11355 [Muribaculaceae bacterium]|nr:hypothetical protein [Muribaculaceae bacterium]
MDNELTTTQAFELSSAGQQLKVFEMQQRMAKALSASDLVPQQYKNNVANCYIALDMAQRMNANPLMVMQNLAVIHGNPSFSAKFIIACIAASGKYQPLEYDFCGEPDTDSYGCRAIVYLKSDTQREHPLVGEWVTIALAKAEGWYGKAGSKWKTMPGQMLRYRAAAWWQRAYDPALSMGFLTTDEVREIEDVSYEEVKNTRSRLADIAAMAVKQQQVEPINENEDNGTENI